MEEDEKKMVGWAYKVIAELKTKGIVRVSALAPTTSPNEYTTAKANENEG